MAVHSGWHCTLKVGDLYCREILPQYRTVRERTHTQDTRILFRDTQVGTKATETQMERGHHSFRVEVGGAQGHTWKGGRPLILMDFLEKTKLNMVK